MQKTTLWAGSLLASLTFSLFQAQAQSGVGTTTENAIYVTHLPYTTTDNTANYADMYDPNPAVPLACGAGTSGNYYMSGNDVVYKFVPSYDATITLSMPNAVGWSALFVFDEPSDIGTSTVLACAASSSSGNRTIAGLPVTAGEDYYIIVSIWATPQTFAYTLNITLDGGNAACSELMMPDGAAVQNFDAEATVADLVVNGTGISWFADEAMTMPLAADAVLESGMYYAQSSLGECTSVPFAVEVNVTLSTQENRALHFSYYPNPVGTELHLKSAVDMVSIDFFNMIGQRVQSQVLDGGVQTVSTAALQPGNYVARVQFANGVQEVIKLVK